MGPKYNEHHPHSKTPSIGRTRGGDQNLVSAREAARVKIRVFDGSLTVRNFAPESNGQN